jgi:hypothetical protein
MKFGYFWATIIVALTLGLSGIVDYTNSHGILLGFSGGAISTSTPFNTLIPQIVGTDYPTVGTTVSLTADVGRWDNSPTNYTYNWHYVGGSTLGTAATLSLNTSTNGVLGQAVEVDVTAQNAAGASTVTSHWFGPIEASAPTTPPSLESYNGGPAPPALGAGTLPVSPANFLQNGHAIFPGCTIPPAVPTNTATTGSQAHVFYFDPINGTTQTAQIAAGVPTGSQGRAGHPFKDISAIFNGTTGYASSPLFGFGATIAPGDTIYIEPGNTSNPLGVLNSSNAIYSTVDGTAGAARVFTWIMMDPAATSRPLLQTINFQNGSEGFLLKSFNVENFRNGNLVKASGLDMIFEDIMVSQWLGHSGDSWVHSGYPMTGGTSDGTPPTASPLISFTASQDPPILAVTASAGSTTLTTPSIPPMGYYVWSPGFFHNGAITAGPSTGIPSGSKVIAINGLNAAQYQSSGVFVNALLASSLTGLTYRGTQTTNQTMPNSNDLTGYWLMEPSVNAAQSVLTWTKNSAAIWFTAQPAIGNTIVADGQTFTFVASGATGNQINIGAALSNTVTNIIAAFKASSDTNLSGGTYTNFSSAIAITYPVAGSNLQFDISSITGATANSWNGVGTIPPAAPNIAYMVMYGPSNHILWWGASGPWSDLGTPSITIGPCDPVNDAATGCPSVAYVNPVNGATISGAGPKNIPGCDPVYKAAGVNIATGGCGTGAPAYAGTTRALTGENATFTDQMKIVPAGAWNSIDWDGGAETAIYFQGGPNAAGSYNPSHPNLLQGATCMSVKDSIIRESYVGIALGDVQNSIVYNNKIKWISGDGMDIYSTNRVWVIHNYYSDPTEIWAHQDALQFGDTNGRGDAGICGSGAQCTDLYYNNAVIENEFYQFSDISNYFPREFQGINTTENNHWGDYIADNIVIASTNGINIDGYYDVVVHNIEISSAIGLGNQPKGFGSGAVFGNGINPLYGLLANNIGNGVSRDARGEIPNLCTADQVTMETNISLSFLPLGSSGNSQYYCGQTVGQTGTNTLLNGSQAGSYIGLNIWTQTDWRSNVSGVSSLFVAYNPLLPAQWVAQNYTSPLVNPCIVNAFPNLGTCTVGANGIMNSRPNASFTPTTGVGAASSSLVSVLYEFYNLPLTTVAGNGYYVANTACFSGPTQPFCNAGVYVATISTTLPDNSVPHLQSAYTYEGPDYNPGIKSAGTQLGAQQPITDIGGNAWGTTPSIGPFQ